MGRKGILDPADLDATNLIARAHTAALVGGDGVPLASAVHTLPNGGTFSNVMATPIAPSVAAYITATSQIMKYPGHNGVVSGETAKCIVAPTEQWGVWEKLMGSMYDPTDANNSLNVVHKHSVPVKTLKHWSSSTTEWALLTNAKQGLRFLWRKKPKGWTAMDHNSGTMTFGAKARWGRGHTNARCGLFVQAT